MSLQIKPIQIESFNIKTEGLDPIDVYIRMDSETAGRITIQCFSQCWTAYWGSMGCGMREFWNGCNIGYLVSAMQNNLLTNSSIKKREKEYLTRIVTAVKAALQENQQ
jgi:hypothetical protein